jgi:glucose-1-phosphate adenylyltransferase
VIDRAIIDNDVVVGANSYVGYGEDNTPNKLEPRNLTTGITVVGHRSRLPEGIKIGRNCKIGTDLKPENFNVKELASGGTIEVR